MLKIAVCDDMEDDRHRILCALSQIEERLPGGFEVFVFPSGKALCQAMSTATFDVVLLDILMDDFDGIATAKCLRKMAANVFIIFISNYDYRIRELFSIRTVAFLDKPVKPDALFRALQDVLEHIQQDHENIFWYQTGRIQKFVYLKDIRYLESFGHHLILHTLKQDITFNDRIKNAWATLQQFTWFIMPHRSYIINLQNIQIETGDHIRLGSDLVISIGKTFREDTMARYLAWRRSCG